VGGFAGIASTLPFNRVIVTFNRNVSTVVVDNFRVTAVPEPSMLLMLALGVPALFWLRRRRAVTGPDGQRCAPQTLA
jgi:PEP-CTERM motif